MADKEPSLVEFSRQRIEKGSRSFAVAAKLFAPTTRDSAYMLYAWCRHCDDVIDGQALGHIDTTNAAPSGTDALAAVQELKEKTRRACRGDADEPVFQALAAVAQKHEIPEKYPLDLIAGFQMDAEERQYNMIEDTLEYCYHVAGVVGVMMAMVMGVEGKERAVLNRACDLGIAFQLTNIARDVIPDHEAGRVYLPEVWLREAGLTRASLAEQANRAALASIARRLLDIAEPYYQSANYGLADLPLRSAWAVATALKVYRAIGVEVRRRGAGAWDTRTSTNTLTKLGGVAAGLAIAMHTRGKAAAGPGYSRSGLWTMQK
ncbi:MAG: phytoene/squalene synthase family protein [Pseudomonadota bacterium]